MFPLKTDTQKNKKLHFLNSQRKTKENGTREIIADDNHQAESRAADKVDLGHTDGD